MTVATAAQQARKTTPAQALRDALARDELIVAPGCFDGLSTRLAVQAGFQVLFMSGFAVSTARLAMPDTGLISFAEMLDTLRNCCAAAEGAPIVADADTGFGNAINVRRTVIEYARAGAACAMIEDQVSPKKCGHTPGKEVVSRGEARMRIRAAVDARTEAGVDILIMARTDARATHGLDEALARCQEFAAEGADLIFLEAPETEGEMKRFCDTIATPCVANMVPGGKTPILPRAQLKKIGYKFAMYPVLSVSSAVAAMQTTLAALKDNDNAVAAPTVAFKDLQTIAGFPDYWQREARYKAND
jgi:2-methylisocitrate lyase-like PEP mutase family enzyme